MKADKPSSTAIFVANGLWWVANNPLLRDEVPAAMALTNRLIIQGVNRGIFSLDTRVGEILLRLKIALMQSLSVPGFYLHFVVRKRCIETMVRQGIEHGAQQLVVIGAGFDTLSLRIAADHPDIPIIEIDHPATQAWKSQAVADQKLNPGNVNFLPLDLMQGTLKDTLLQSPCYKPERSTIFVAEGLLMYLRESDVKDLLHVITQNSGPNSRFVFTYMEAQSPEDYQFENARWFVNFWLKIKGEKFTWGLQSKNLGAFIEKSGMVLLSTKTHRELRAEILAPGHKQMPLACGENVAVAETRKQ